MGGSKEPLEMAPPPGGPVKRRSCTDIICLTLFLVFILGWAGVSVLGFKDGDPEQLLYPTDSLGNICGREQGGNEGRPVLLFHDLLRCLSATALVMGCPTPQVCVAECPGLTTSLYAYSLFIDIEDGSGGDFTNFDLDFQRKLCVPSLSDEDWDAAIKSGQGIRDLIKERKCPAYTLSSLPIAGRCVPDFGIINHNTTTSNTPMTDDEGNPINTDEGGSINAGKVLEMIKQIVEILNLQGFAENVLSDLVQSWQWLLIGLGIGLGVSFLWIFLMRFIAGVMVWLSLFLTFGLLGLSAAYCWIKYSSLEGNAGADEDFWAADPISEGLDVYLQLRTTWLVLFILSCVLAGIILLLTLFLRSRIKIAIELISEGSKAVGSIMSSVFYPIFSFLLQFVIMAWFLLVFTFLASSSEKLFTVEQDPTGSCPELEMNRTSCAPEEFNVTGCLCTFTRLVKNDTTNYMQLYNVFMLFWGLCFVSALGEMVLAGAFSSWYWVLHKSDVPAMPVLNSFGRTFRYHLGTLAFGSLIIAIIKMIRMMLQYVQDKLEEMGADNPVVKVVLCLCKCCFWCLEKFMKFINRNAYILTAIQGSNFCMSAKEAFSLIIRNMVRVAVLDKVTDFLLFLGKMVVTATVAICSFYYFSGGIDAQVPNAMARPDLNYYFIPVIFITIGTYFLASCFFSVYAMAVDTLFLCFLVDLEQNDGSAEKPYYMSKNLMQILDLKNKHDKAK